MDFRRIPFQFSTTDPSKRQEELQRRFGLPANKGNMFVDVANLGTMGTRSDSSSVSNSPRLQHRVPIFVEGKSEPTKPSVDAQNVDSGRKPHVRVVPIEIEGADNASKKHHWFSGSSEPMKERVNGTSIPVETIKHPVQEPSPQFPKAPRVCNIPIKIKGSDHTVQPQSPVKTHKVKMPEPSKHTRVKPNGCSASKVAKVNEKKESPEDVTLKKIQNVEKKLKGYHTDVEKFSGTVKEKQYRYLDEMLTRCMLELDEIDTMGLDTIRLARKAAVKKVQASIDLLESKIIKENKRDRVSKEPMEVKSSGNTKDADMKVEAVPVKTCIDNQLNTDAVNFEVSEMLPENVENISIMETEEAVLKPDEKEPVLDNSISVTNDKKNVDATEPLLITEVVVGDNIVTSEIEPIVEEPLSDSKDENAIDMDLDSFNCEIDMQLDAPSSVQICEVGNDAVSDPNKLSAGTIRLLDQNLKLEITETSDIPVVSEQFVLSNDNIQVTACADELLPSEQSVTSIDSDNMSNSS